MDKLIRVLGMTLVGMLFSIGANRASADIFTLPTAGAPNSPIVAYGDFYSYSLGALDLINFGNNSAGQYAIQASIGQIQNYLIIGTGPAGATRQRDVWRFGAVGVPHGLQYDVPVRGLHAYEPMDDTARRPDQLSRCRQWHVDLLQQQPAG
jgi:hypothetical protein